MGSDAPAPARPVLECRRLAPDHLESLTEFFRSIEASGDTRYFHPHPFDRATAKRLCSHTGNDMYYVLVEAGRVLAYGMLRGWDEGYEVPSLGICTHPDARNQGIARLLMTFLHASARRRGAERIRLKSYPENGAALQLYTGLGYKTVGEHGAQLVLEFTF